MWVCKYCGIEKIRFPMRVCKECRHEIREDKRWEKLSEEERHQEVIDSRKSTV